MTDDSAWLGYQRLPEVTVHASGALAQTIRAELRQTRRVRTDVQVAVCIMTRVRETPLWREVVEQPAVPIRMLDHGDQLSGAVERGYSGRSIFFRDGSVVPDLTRVRAYARLLASIGINAVGLVNADLPDVARLAAVFREYGIAVSLSVEFTDDPTDERVARWWSATISRVYDAVPDFGGLVVRAGRDAEGANLLARAIAPYGGTVFWRYSDEQAHDWRDRSTDRARAALLGELQETVLALELQVTQEYSGQQQDLCYLGPWWREILQFDTTGGGGPTVADRIGAIVAVSNVGDDPLRAVHRAARGRVHGHAADALRAERQRVRVLGAGHVPLRRSVRRRRGPDRDDRVGVHGSVSGATREHVRRRRYLSGRVAVVLPSRCL
jgi:alpha-glucuronidase